MQGQIFDISPTIDSQIGVFPGDQKFEHQVSLSFEKGDSLVLSSMRTTLHLGAHVDAPIHYHPQGIGMAERDLNYYLGACQVIQVDVKQGERVSPKMVKTEICAERVLFHTGTFPDPQKWNSDFAALTPELIVFLAGQGVRLVGIDTPSIDLENSKELPTHQAIYQNDMAILEGIVLSHVPEGLYQLIALPLKIKGADASPVRAVLLK